MKRIYKIIPIPVLVMMLLVACSTHTAPKISDEPNNGANVQNPVDQGDTEQEENEEIDEPNTVEESTMTKVNIIVNNKIFQVTLEDNQTSREFASHLPLTVTMADHLSNEKHFDLSSGLTTNSSNPGMINTGDLMLYGSRTIVLFYDSFSTSYSYTRLGKVDDPSGLSVALGSGSIEVTFEMIVDFMSVM